MKESPEIFIHDGFADTALLRKLLFCSRFDEDLAGDSYQGEGPYLKLRFKFDEKIMKGFK
jgi:hypothetical protein